MNTRRFLTGPLSLAIFGCAFVLNAAAATPPPKNSAPATPAQVQAQAELDSLRDLSPKLAGVAQVLGEAIQVAQDCGLSLSDMQGTHKAYETILSSGHVIGSLRTHPEIRKIWPTEADFRAAYLSGQQAAIKRGRPTDETCVKVRIKFPEIDTKQSRLADALSQKLKLVHDQDEQEAQARIDAGENLPQ